MSQNSPDINSKSSPVQGDLAQLGNPTSLPQYPQLLQMVPSQTQVSTQETTDMGVIVKDIEESNTKFITVLGDSLNQQSKVLGDSLNQQNKMLQKTWIWFSVFIGFPLVLLAFALFIVILFTIFFLFFPKQATHLFSTSRIPLATHVVSTPSTFARL